MQIKDTVLCVLSDMHTGGSTALFPPNGFTTNDNLVLPSTAQREIHTTFTRLAGEVRQIRKGKRLVLINLGDAIDGFHHGSMQESIFIEDDQKEAHLDLMREFMKKAGYKNDDELHYVKGTEVHVKDREKDIAKELGASIQNTLLLNINGTFHMFAHHGKKRGGGQNEGNALRNFLRDIRYDRRKDGLQRIDVLWSGHTHAHTWNTHIEREGEEFHEFHGIICPSFQAKTRYANMVAPMAVNSIGGVYMRISAAGEISRPKFVVKVTEDD